jgi:hypothetical protein
MRIRVALRIAAKQDEGGESKGVLAPQYHPAPCAR